MFKKFTLTCLSVLLSSTFVLAQTGHLVQLPNVDMSTMMPILLGMLGLAGARSFERVKGKA